MTISSWLNFGGPAPPGRGFAAGRNFLARNVCVSLSVFFIDFGFLFFVVFVLVICGKCQVKFRRLVQEIVDCGSLN